MSEHYEETVRALREVFGRPDPVVWRQFGVPPPAPFYITRDDRLFLRARNIFGGLTTFVRARILQPDPREGVRQWEQPFVTTGSGTVEAGDFELGEGFLMSLTLHNGITAMRRGQFFIQAGLNKGPVALGKFQALLISDYMTPEDVLAWPGGLMRSSIEGPGNLESRGGTDPAAGVEISETVPTNRRWRFLSFRFSLVTSAVAGTRRVHLVLDDGVNILHDAAANDGHAASLTRNYNCAPEGFQRAAQDSEIYIPTPLEGMRFQGFRVRTLTTGLDAGDNFGAPRFMVESWIED